jgi:hypothetical protein
VMALRRITVCREAGKLPRRCIPSNESLLCGCSHSNGYFSLVSVVGASINSNLQSKGDKQRNSLKKSKGGASKLRVWKIVSGNSDFLEEASCSSQSSLDGEGEIVGISAQQLTNSVLIVMTGGAASGGGYVHKRTCVTGEVIYSRRITKTPTAVTMASELLCISYGASSLGLWDAMYGVELAKFSLIARPAAGASTWILSRSENMFNSSYEDRISVFRLQPITESSGAFVAAAVYRDRLSLNDCGVSASGADASINAPSVFRGGLGGVLGKLAASNIASANGSAVDGSSTVVAAPSLEEGVDGRAYRVLSSLPTATKRKLQHVKDHYDKEMQYEHTLLGRNCDDDPASRLEKKSRTFYLDIPADAAEV